MTKLDEVKAAKVRKQDVLDLILNDENRADCLLDIEALSIYEAILENRVLIVPVEPVYELLSAGNITTKQYKAMTQAVDVDKLIEEITND